MRIVDGESYIGRPAIPAETPENSPAPEALSQIRSGEYYPVGLERRRVSIMRHFVKTQDMVVLIHQLLGRSRESARPVHLVVADSPDNIFVHLKRGNAQKPAAEQVPDAELLANAKSEARLMGLCDRILYESIAGCLCSSEGEVLRLRKRLQELLLYAHRLSLLSASYDTATDAPDLQERCGAEVGDVELEIEDLKTQISRLSAPEFIDPGSPLTCHLLSELLDDPEYLSLQTRVADLVARDSDFAEKVFACVPKNTLPKEHRYKRFSQLCGPYATVARDLMQYVVSQISTVLFLQGRKLGHEGELVYNQVTKLAAEKLGIATISGSNFETLALPGVDGLPYRGHALDRAAESALSLDVDLQSDLISDDEYERIQAALYDEPEVRRAIQARVERQGREMENKITLLCRIYKEIFASIETKVTAEERETIRELFEMYFAQEVVSMLSHHQPLAVLFKWLGINDVINGKTKPSSLHVHNGFIPFSCPQLEDESECRYFTRFIGELLRGGSEGPIFELAKSENAYHEAAIAKNIWEFTDEDPKNFAHLSPYWHICCDEIPGLFFNLEDPASRCHSDRAAHQLNIKRWSALDQLFTLAQGTSLEPVIRSYIQGEASPLSTNHEYSSIQKFELQNLLATNLFNPQLVARLRLFTGLH